MKIKTLRVVSSGVLGVLFGAVPAFASTVSLLPVGDGSFTQFTPSSGTTHYTLVNESTCDGAGSYTSTTGIGNRDSFSISLSSIPDLALISAIKIKPCASRVSVGGANPVANVFYRWNGINSSDSGSYTLTGTTPIELATTTYSVGLTKFSGSSLEIGAVLTSGTKGMRLSRLATEITYNFVEAPTSLVGTATTSASSTPAVSLSWTDSSSTETAFVLEGKMTSSTLWKIIATTSPNAVSYVDTKVASTTGSYNHRLRAFDGTVYSAYSNISTTTVP